MERNDEHREEALIELGAVSAETKGPGGIVSDNQGGRQLGAGLSDD